MAGQNKTIAELSAWAADPEKMHRFEAVALLCQRTSFVKTLLCLSDNDDLIRAHIQRICEKNGVVRKIPRGNGFDVVYLKSQGPDVRYVASFLLNTLLSSGDGGLTSTRDGINHVNLVDRLIYSYRRYLTIFMVSIEEAKVSFELFYHLYKCYESGEIEMTLCGNCDSIFTNFRVAQAVRCPICQTQRLAELPRTVLPAIPADAEISAPTRRLVAL